MIPSKRPRVERGVNEDGWGGQVRPPSLQDRWNARKKGGQKVDTSGVKPGFFLSLRTGESKDMRLVCYLPKEHSGPGDSG